MAKDDQAPATKADIKGLMIQIGRYYDKTEKRLLALKEELLDNIERRKEETIRHFDVIAEDIRHDLEGANRDTPSR